jgi:hypothetical protein
MGFAHEFLQQLEFVVVPNEEEDDDQDDSCCVVVVGNSSESDEPSTLSMSTSMPMPTSMPTSMPSSMPSSIPSSMPSSMPSSISTMNTIEERIMELVKCQIKEATYDYKLSCLIRPSHVAFGALSNALQSLNIDSSDLDSMRMLKHRLQIPTTIWDNYDTSMDFVRDALLQAVSSSDERSNNPLSSLLLHRCGHNSNSERHKVEPQRTTDASPLSLKSSSVPSPSSPKTVLEGIPC